MSTPPRTNPTFRAKPTATSPGQVKRLGYKVGQLQILALRQYAKDQLGEKFDIRGFHDQVLGAGALPMNVLVRPHPSLGCGAESGDCRLLEARRPIEESKIHETRDQIKTS